MLLHAPEKVVGPKDVDIVVVEWDLGGLADCLIHVR